MAIVMRPRFTTGLAIGLGIGLPLGALVAAVVLPSKQGDTQRLEQQLEELSLRLDEQPEQLDPEVLADLASRLEALELSDGKSAEADKAKVQLLENHAREMGISLARLKERLESLERRSNW